jgi:hypothetical protein
LPRFLSRSHFPLGAGIERDNALPIGSANAVSSAFSRGQPSIHSNDEQRAKDAQPEQADDVEAGE